MNSIYLSHERLWADADSSKQIRKRAPKKQVSHPKWCADVVDVDTTSSFSLAVQVLHESDHFATYDPEHKSRFVTRTELGHYGSHGLGWMMAHFHLKMDHRMQWSILR